ncbi:hypothetical protein [uncultured Deinococcus sp.]|uniref:hypothetical protein n=1 Tax=uncultured Deinococcus sp. TaxID=158789 RepID=UPI0025E22A9D|nr:hypothetical protein [uncultured Deinococcus sp.]
MSRVTIDDPAAVEVLLDSSKTRLLAPFMLEAQTVAAVAEATGYSHSALAYWVKRFVKLGLLTEVEGSRPAQFRAVATEFVVDPTRVMPLEDMLGHLNGPGWERLLQGYTQEYRRLSPDWLVLLQATPQGALIRREVTPLQLAQASAGGWDAPLNEWGVMRLRREQARELRERMLALVMEYFEQASESQGDEVYFLHLGLTRDAVHG